MATTTPTHNTNASVADVDLGDTRALRDALGLVPTPLATAAALVDGTPVGMLIGSFVGHSLEPALVSISIQRSSTTWPRLREADSIGLSILSEANRGSLDNFYRPTDDRFIDLDYETDGSAILLPGAAVNATVSLVEEIDVGDHVLAIARIDRATTNTTDNGEGLRPLVFHRSVVTTIL